MSKNLSMLKEATDPTTGTPAILNDRPPLLLRAAVQAPAGAPFPITVIVNHLRSLTGVDDPWTATVFARSAGRRRSP